MDTVVGIYTIIRVHMYMYNGSETWEMCHLVSKFVLQIVNFAMRYIKELFK